MSVYIEKFGFGSEWTDFQVDTYEGYLPNMSDYHMHEYYELSLILSGSVKVLLPYSVQSGTECRLVLTRPQTAHLIVCEPHILYQRINLLFSHQFIADHTPEYKQLLSSFGKHGRVVILSSEQVEKYRRMIEEFKKEGDLFRKRLILMYLLSCLSELSGNEPDELEEPPAFVSRALQYLQENCHRKILASELAWELGVGRTTLMTEFKKYTGSTVGNYLTDCRLRLAIARLKEGELQSSVAEACGFGDACNMIRTFRRRFGMTPSQYVKRKQDQDPVHRTETKHSGLTERGVMCPK